MATFQEMRSIQEAFVTDHAEDLVQGAKMIGESIRKGGKLLIFGNGGSAADAQHMAAEMVGRMLIDRKPLPAIALTTDSSNLTAVGNDFGYDLVFVKQVQALCKKEDVVLAISTSGNSKNVLVAVEEAKKIGAKVIGLTGGSGGKLKSLSDLFLCARLGKNSSRIQESHIFAVHSLVDVLDRFFLEG
ncbi:MAG: SIS domain-containing protein [Bdellovibrionales bacterium]|nr:SIS domain-containing protein [Bdellovibrionales bacterium]